MNTLLRRSIYALFATLTLVAFSGCSKDDYYLHYALKAAGENKSELKAVLKHYRTVDKDPEKLKAAKFLIANMPGHYSYADTAKANRYYAVALKILTSDRDMFWKRDTIQRISAGEFSGMERKVVPDVQVITADYLIYNIDHAFTQWRTRPWAQHMSYDEFCEYLLPYKVVELQKFDHWRDTLIAHFGDSISRLPADNEQCHTIYGVQEIARNELYWKMRPNILWETSNGYPLLSAETMVNMKFGACTDYVMLATAFFRSVGIPTYIDDIKHWGRGFQGHTWYAFTSDNGILTPTSEDITTPASWGFFTYERFPKINRSTYSMNRDVLKYRNKAKYVHPFNYFKHDVTDLYYRTSDVQIKIKEGLKLKDKYVYIALFHNNNGPTTSILDFGRLKKGMACFKKMGRELMYIAMGFDGQKLIPISDPFIIKKDGSVEYVEFDNSATRNVKIRRKYYESYNVVHQRRKILGAQIQCSDNRDFSDAVTLYTIETTEIPNRIKLNAPRPYRYWRYMSPDGSWGNMAELAWFDDNGDKLSRKGIANAEAGQDAIERAYDGNLLSNFEINQPNGNWIGMDMGKPTMVSSVMVIPRSDDNDVFPGNEYELLYWNGLIWKSAGYQVATENVLEYEVPVKCLFWLRNYTRGRDERPFVIKEDGKVEWW